VSLSSTCGFTGQEPRAAAAVSQPGLVQQSEHPMCGRPQKTWDRRSISRSTSRAQSAVCACWTKPPA
jgi:hypothetical protein